MGIHSNFYSFLLFLVVFVNVFEWTLSDQVNEKSYANQDLNLEPFDTSITHRQNFCDEQARYQRGDVEFNLALEGRNVNVALGRDKKFINIVNDTDLSIAVGDPGLQVVLMDEVARRGKFTWRNSFTFTPFRPEGSTWTQYLAWMVDSYDVSVSWWYISPEREALGISFPMGWYDGTVIMIKKENPVKYLGAFHLYAWSDPFTPGVWLLLLVTLIFTGCVALYLDPNSRGGKFPTFDILLSNLQTSLIAFTGSIELHPSTHAAKAVSLSLSFFAMLMLSAYTANLASFLVIEKSSVALEVNTVGDIVKFGKTICIDGSAAPREAIEQDYPNAIFIEKNGDEDSLLGLKNDECDYAILGLSSWEDVSANALIICCL